MIGTLLDSSALYALADQHDKWHKAMARAVETQPGERIVPVTVLTEASYMIGTHLGPAAERRLIRAVIAGEFLLEGLGMHDLGRVGALLAKYVDADIGLVDATVVALAERLKITTIATTDHHHLRLIRPRHFTAFTLIP
jgi:uncharacterized protein